MTASAELAALQTAGIPIDGQGNTKSGYLFVRTIGRGDNRTNIFRWFATSIGETPFAPPQARYEGAPSVF